MGLYIQDSDGAFYVKDGMAIHDNRGHKEIMKRFRSDAEAEEVAISPQSLLTTTATTYRSS